MLKKTLYPSHESATHNVIILTYFLALVALFYCKKGWIMTKKLEAYFSY